MNKVELSGKITKIAGILEEEGGEVRGAAELLRLSKELVDAKPSAELEGKIGEMTKLAQAFKDKHPEAIKVLADAEKKVKEAERALKSEYDVWPDKGGFEAVRLEVLRMAQTSLAIGEKIDNVVDGLLIAKRNSIQPLYKEWVAYLQDTLNAVEANKFIPLLTTCFRKTFTEIKTGIEVLDKNMESISDEAKAAAKEKGFDIEKMIKLKKAGVVDNVAIFFKEFSQRAIKKITGWANDLLSKIQKNSTVLDKLSVLIDKDIDKISSALRKAE